MNPVEDSTVKQILENLQRFRNYERRVLADAAGAPKLKELELVGIRRMIGQLQSQLRCRRAELVQNRLGQLRSKLRAPDADLAGILDSALTELEEVTELAKLPS